MRKKFGLKVLAISIALVLIASSAMVYSSQKGEKGIDEGGGKGVISLLTPPFIGIAGASEMQGDDAGSSAPRAGTSFIEEEAGIIKYADGEQEIDIQKIKSDNYSHAQSEMEALSSTTTYYENFTMLICEEKCSSTHNYCPGSTCLWNYYTISRPSFIKFSTSFYTYCIRILKEAKPGTYEFQVEYCIYDRPYHLVLDHKIIITVNIPECHNCSILTGVVTDMSDNPVHNAEIRIKNWYYRSIYYYTNRTGFYSTGPLRHGTYTISVSPPSGVNLPDKVITVNITQNTTLNITLPFGGILTGRITDENGTGIYNARVTARGPSYKNTNTNTTGYYSIIGLLAGNYTVTASPPSGTNLLSNSKTESVMLGETTTIDIILPEAGIIAGRVTDENGTGIYHARVATSGPSYKETHTNTTRCYRIIGLLAGNYTVTAYPPRGANLFSNSTTASVTLGETTTVDIMLPEAGIIAGRVTDENGTGIYNARITALGPVYKKTNTNTTGYYRIIRLLAGNYAVTASPPSGTNLFLNSTAASVTLGETTTADLILPEAGTIAGRVTDENGTGIDHAHVTVSGPWYESTYTNTTGYYIIIRLLAGNYTVTAYPPSGTNLLSNSTAARVTLKETTIVNIILPEAGIIAGRVTYENGTGIDHALVTASGPSSKNAYTNTTGHYCIIRLLAGNYTVTASPPSGTNLVSNSTTASVTLGETTIVNIILPEAGIIAGRVTYENGTGIYNAAVTASGPSSKNAYTNTTGYYRLNRLLAGNYIVTAYPPSGTNLFSNFTRESVTLGETTTVNIILSEVGIIAGRVTDENGTGIYNARITASAVPYKCTLTNTTGYYRINRLLAGNYTVTAYPPRGANLFSNSTAASVTFGETTIVNIILPEAGIIAGRVTDENGTGIYNARVTAYVPGNIETAYTNTTGYYRIIRLLAGNYTVTASPLSGTNLLSNSTAASVTLGETKVMDFVLRPRENYP